MKIKNILQSLIDLDEEVFLTFGNKRNIECIIVGSSVLIIDNLISRMTSDIDSLFISENLENIYVKYGLNTRVVSHSDSFSPSYRDRMTVLEIDTKVMKYYVLSLEDIVVSKVSASRPQDIEDIINPLVINKLNWDSLENIYQEVFENALNDRIRSELKSSYNNYISKYKRS